MNRKIALTSRSNATDGILNGTKGNDAPCPRLTRRKVLGALGSSIALPAVLSTAASASAPSAPAGSWTIVGLPDTQHYTDDDAHLPYGQAQTQWIADNAHAQNIKFVSHEGDMVEHGETEREWTKIAGIMDTIDGVVPYATVPGNHDWAADQNGGRLTKSTSIQHYRDHFGKPSGRYDSKSWFGGFGPDNGGNNANINSYQLFSAGGYDFLHLALEWEPAGSVDDPSTPLGWAKHVLNLYPDRPTIVTTHSYLADKKASDGYADRSYQAQSDDGTGGHPSSYVWNNFVRRNPQIFLVLGGHRYNMAHIPSEQYHAGEGHMLSTNEAGQPVYQLLTDYQWKPNGGNGWLQLVRFIPGGGANDKDRIHAITYSPVLDSVMTNTTSYHSSDYFFDLDFSARFEVSGGGGGGGSSALPKPWNDVDVGNVSSTGSASESSGTFTVKGGGSNIYGTKDAFHFVYQQLSGDGEIRARVASQEHTADYAKAGVMIRETLGQSATNALTRVDPVSDAGTDFQYRDSTGGETTVVQGDDSIPPVWVRLVRSGDTFTGYESQDGSSWTEIGTQSISMATDVYVGLAVSSNKDGTLCTVEFDNVQVSNPSEGPTAPGVDTTDATDVGESSATLNGKLITLGNASSTDVWFRWWPQGDQGSAVDTTHQTLTATDAFEASIDGLSTGTTYVFQAMADNGSGTDQGGTLQFTPTAVVGDVNGDGTVDDQDVTDVQEYIAGKQPSSGSFNATKADVDHDGDVDIVDAMQIRKDRSKGGSS